MPTGTAAGAQQLVNAQPEELIPAGTINFQGVDVSQVLEIYAQLVGRTLLRAGLPAAQIVLKTQTPLTKTEAIQALQAVLALNGIAVVNIHPPTVLFALFVADGLSGYVIYGWRKAKGLQTSVISTSTDEPDERGLHK